MYFTVTFKDGTVTHIPVSNSHTVRVISPQDQVQDAFSFDGVQSITLDPDGAPTATVPNPQPTPGAAEGPTVDNAADSPLIDLATGKTLEQQEEAAAAGSSVAVTVSGGVTNTGGAEQPEAPAEPKPDETIEAAGK